MANEDTPSNVESIGHERSSSDNVTIIAETLSNNATNATLSSIKSQDSTEQLICKSPQDKNCKKKSIVDTHAATLDRCYDKGNTKKARDNILTNGCKSLETENSDISVSKHRPKIILLLGLGQLSIGILMVVFGALVIVHNSSLSRVGAGLWSGSIAIATGMVGVLAGINDCYGLYGAKSGARGNPFLTAFLTLSLASLAAGNMAAVLAGTGLYRDYSSSSLPELMDAEYEDERKAWTPILTNIGLLLIAVIHCFLALLSIFQASKRVCSCFRQKEPFNHNQFNPTSYKNMQSTYSVVNVTEKPREKSQSRDTGNSLSPRDRNGIKDLCKSLESKLVNSDIVDGHQQEKLPRAKLSHEMGKEGNFGSANSKDKLVHSWLGKHHVPVQKAGRPVKCGVRKMKLRPQPLFLVPAHPMAAMGRGMPVQMVPVARYATLPLMPVGPAAHFAPPICYPCADMVRVRRRRGSPGRARRDSHLTRSLERIHRRHQPAEQNGKRSKGNKTSKTLSEQELISTYTGLDRTIAEEFIVACDVTRNVHSATMEKADSSGFDTASSDCPSNRF